MRATLSLTFIALFFLAGFSAQASHYLIDNRTKELKHLAATFTQAMVQEDEAQALAFADKKLRKKLEGKTAGIWAHWEDMLGPFKETGPYVFTPVQNFLAVDIELIFSNGELTQRTVFDDQNRIADLFYFNIRKNKPAAVLLQNVTEN